MNHDQFNDDLKVIQDAQKRIKSHEAEIQKEKKIITDATARMSKQAEVETKPRKPKKQAKPNPPIFPLDKGGEKKHGSDAVPPPVIPVDERKPISTRAKDNTRAHTNSGGSSFSNPNHQSGA